MSIDSVTQARIGDYVLGLADDADRDRLEADMAAEPQLRAAVDAFAARLSALDDTAAIEAASPDLWPRIEAALDTAPATAPAGAKVISLRPDKPAFRLTRLALAASLLATVALGFGAGLMTARTPQPVVMVVLNTPDNRPGAVFEAFADNSVRIVPLEAFSVPEGQVMQVWTLYDPAVGPVSLGTLAESDVVTLSGQPLPRPSVDQLYEITLEQAPGSPTGKPTGPILVKGFAKSALPST